MIRVHGSTCLPGQAFLPSSFPSGPQPGKAGRRSLDSCYFRGPFQFAEVPYPFELLCAKCSISHRQNQEKQEGICSSGNFEGLSQRQHKTKIASLLGREMLFPFGIRNWDPSPKRSWSAGAWLREPRGREGDAVCLQHGALSLGGQSWGPQCHYVEREATGYKRSPSYKIGKGL